VILGSALAKAACRTLMKLTPARVKVACKHVGEMDPSLQKRDKIDRLEGKRTRKKCEI
jgi:hypothetical protein